MMWDERYNEEGFAYGTPPNDFLVEVANRIPAGSVLCLAEGEGRNAVFLAARGHQVLAVVERERDVVEGKYHNGSSAVVQLLARKLR